MKAVSRERGATAAVLAPILAAIIGGGGAILAAVQIVSLAPDSEQAQTSNTGNPAGDVDYGDR